MENYKTQLASMNNALSEWEKKMIGKGILFPEGLNPNTKSIEISEAFDRIDQSIYVILSTPKGSRFGNREFGSDLIKMVFEQNDTILQDLIRIEVNEAISRWEPRVTVTNVEFLDSNDNIDANILPIIITYCLKNSDLSNNYVYIATRNI